MPLFGFGRKKDEPSFASVYLNLRSMVLKLNPVSTGMEPTAELPNVWGVIVDWGTDDSTATFVALADGTGSMYTSSGGGTIGGQGQPTVAAAGRQLLQAAEEVHSALQLVAGFDRPKLREVRYWVLTHRGARSVAHGPEGPPAGDSVLSRLGAAFQDYFSAFRALDEGGAGSPG
jgi:hypothetical protein